MKDFAKLAAPLHELTKKNARFVWSDRAQNAFESLKLALTTPPVLAMPVDEREFCLLAFREVSYCITRKELLAVVYFLKQFKQYLLGRRFTIRTDHASLTWLRRSPEPIGQNARWLEQTEEYDFQIVHRPGAQHGNADALSRRPCEQKGCVCDQVVTVDRAAELSLLSSVLHEELRGPVPSDSTLAQYRPETVGPSIEPNLVLNVFASPFISGIDIEVRDDILQPTTSFVSDVSAQSDGDRVNAVNMCDGVNDEEDTGGDDQDGVVVGVNGDENSAVVIEDTRGDVGEQSDPRVTAGP